MTGTKQGKSIDMILAAVNMKASNYVEGVNAFNGALNRLRINQDIRHADVRISADDSRRPIVIGDFSFKPPTIQSKETLPNEDVSTMLKTMMNLNWRSNVGEQDNQRHKKIAVLLVDGFLFPSLTGNDLKSYPRCPCFQSTDIYRISSELVGNGIRLIVSGIDEVIIKLNVVLYAQISQMTGVIFVSLKNLENFIVEYCNSMNARAVNDENVSDANLSVSLPLIPRSKPIPIPKRSDYNDKMIIGKPPKEHFLF